MKRYFVYAIILSGLAYSMLGSAEGHLTHRQHQINVALGE